MIRNCDNISSSSAGLLSGFVMMAMVATIGLYILLQPKSVTAEPVLVETFGELDSFFEEKGYSVAKWKANVQPVPPLVILDIPESWRKKIAPKMTTEKKKRTFFRFAIPLAFVANDRITEDRAKLLKLEKEFSKSRSVADEDHAWLKKQAETYGVEAETMNTEMFSQLSHRIDIIPPSLIVAQMADESGWGTSRFAAEGNALFGQWSYSGGIKPKDQRASKGDYKIKAFKTPLDSVLAYMTNLNGNAPYEELRKQRAVLRSEGKPLTGSALVGTLIDYSERHEAYVKDIKALMEHNKLLPLDTARIAEGGTVYIRLHSAED